MDCPWQSTSCSSTVHPVMCSFNPDYSFVPIWSKASKSYLSSDLSLSSVLFVEENCTSCTDAFGREGVKSFSLVFGFVFSSFASSEPVYWGQYLRSWGTTSNCCSTQSPPSDLMLRSSPRFLASSVLTLSFPAVYSQLCLQLLLRCAKSCMETCTSEQKSIVLGLLRLSCAMFKTVWLKMWRLGLHFSLAG